MGATRTRISTMVVAVACAAAVLAGCTSGDDPPVTTPTADTSSPTVPASPSASPSVSAAPSPSSTALTEEEVVAQLPEEALTEDFPSAVLFTRFFVESYGSMFKPPYDTALFEFLSDPQCGFCASGLASVQSAVDEGVTAESGTFSWAESVGAAEGGLSKDDFWYIEQPFEVTETVATLADGTVERGQEGRGSITAKLKWADTHWQVHGVNLEYADE